MSVAVFGRRRGLYRATVLADGPVAFWDFADAANPKPADYYAALLATSPVAVWKLGDASGLPQDSVGSYHCEAVGGNPTYGHAGAVRGDTTTCMDFDGTGDWARVAFDAALNPAAFTVSAWVMRDTDTGAAEVIVDCIASNTGFRISVTSGDLFAGYIGNGSTTVSSQSTETVLPVGKWAHVAYTNDGATSKLYVNGYLADSDAAVYVPNASGKTMIGAMVAGTFPWNGKLQYVAIHNTVLTAAQIRTLAQAGCVLRDSVGGYHGGLFGARTAASGAPNGRGAAVSFAGGATSGDYAIVPYSANLNTAQFSISGWFTRGSDTGQNETMIETRSSTNVGYLLYVSTTDKLTFGCGTGGSIPLCAGATNVPASRWHHFAVTYDASNMRVYLNGALDGGPTAAALSANASADMWFAARNIAIASWICYFDGKLDDVAYFNKALTAAQIQRQYRAGLKT